MNTKTTPTAVDIQAELRLLYVDRALAELEGSASDPRSMVELVEAIQEHESAFAGTAVTEIALLRAELDGPLQG